MEAQFIPYNLALKLKELGFVFYPFGYYSLLEDNKIIESTFYASDDFLEAPLWQQAFDWFREKYKFKVGIGINDKGLYYDYKIVLFNTTDTYYKDCYNTYTDARLDCLNKLIELVEKK